MTYVRLVSTLLPVVVVLVLGVLSAGGCCCGPEPQLSELARLTAGDPTYVALKLTPLGPADDGGEQVLIESQVVSAPRGTDLTAALESSADTSAFSVLSEVPGARVLQKPSVVTTVTETATIEVSYEDGSEVSLDRLSVTVHPGAAEGTWSIEVTYLRTAAGRRAFEIGPKTLEVPAGQVVVLAAERL